MCLYYVYAYDVWYWSHYPQRQREVMATLSIKGPPVACSEEAEILACRRAVEFALECGFTKLVLEGDNQAIMTALSSRRGLVSQLDRIIQDVICLRNNPR